MVVDANRDPRLQVALTLLAPVNAHDPAISEGEGLPPVLGHRHDGVSVAEELSEAPASTRPRPLTTQQKREGGE